MTTERKAADQDASTQSGTAARGTDPPPMNEDCVKGIHEWSPRGLELTRHLTRYYCRRCPATRVHDTLND